MQAACLSWTDQSVCSKLHSTAALAYLTLKQSLCLLPKQKAAKSPSVFFQRCKGIPMHVSNFCLEYIFPPLSCCCKSLVCFGMCHFLFFFYGVNGAEWEKVNSPSSGISFRGNSRTAAQLPLCASTYRGAGSRCCCSCRGTHRAHLFSLHWRFLYVLRSNPDAFLIATQLRGFFTP